MHKAFFALMAVLAMLGTASSRVWSAASPFAMFMSHDIDPFESEQIAPERERAVTLQQCQHCHFGNAADNIISARRFAFPLPSSTLPMLIASDSQAEAARIIAWKQSQGNWKKLMMKFWAEG